MAQAQQGRGEGELGARARVAGNAGVEDSRATQVQSTASTSDFRPDQILILAVGEDQPQRVTLREEDLAGAVGKMAMFGQW